MPPAVINAAHVLSLSFVCVAATSAPFVCPYPYPFLLLLPPPFAPTMSCLPTFLLLYPRASVGCLASENHKLPDAAKPGHKQVCTCVGRVQCLVAPVLDQFSLAFDQHPSHERVPGNFERLSCWRHDS